MSLEIVHYNHPVLRKKGEKITVFDTALEAFAQQMVDTMHAAHGIGLAAQQVGRAIQLCVVDLRETEMEFDWRLDGARTPLDLIMPLVIINPKVTESRKAPKEPLEEGCLSFPEIRADVVRTSEITVKFQDHLGHPHVLECTDLLARCVMHEADHLNGILFIDRMDKAARAGIDEAVKELARRTKAGKSPSSP